MVPAPDFDPVTCSSESGHPYAYARILGVFHVDIIHNLVGRHPKQITIEFLLVRWFRVDSCYKAGFTSQRLHRIELVPETDDSAFGFLNPDDIIRGTHLIPAFAHGCIEDRLGSLYYSGLWKYYYVNMYVLRHSAGTIELELIPLHPASRFVDRDMYMRYRGDGVGHTPIKVPEPTDKEEAQEADDTEDDGQGNKDDASNETEDEDMEEDEEGKDDEDEDEDDESDGDPEEGQSAEDREGYDEL